MALSALPALLAALTLAAPALAADSGDGLGEGMVNPGYEAKPPWFKQSFLDIREDVDEAAAAGRRVMLYFYQDGCPYCEKLLQDNFARKDLVDKTREHFDVIAINLWGDRQVTGLEGEATSEKRFAADLEVMFTPTLVFLDEGGAPVLRINGYYPPAKMDRALDYVAGGHEDTPFGRWRAEARAQVDTAPLSREPGFLEPPLRLKPALRAGDGAPRPLVVFFEEAPCADCRELHQDILKRPRTREQLERVDAAVVNIHGETPLVTPGGFFRKARDWARELDIQYAPTLVFFDAAGEEVFRTEAYLRSFHVQSALDYVASGAYREQPNFQRYLQGRADALEAAGVHVDLMD